MQAWQRLKSSWTRHTFATDNQDRPVWPTDDEAVSWSIIGAIKASYLEHEEEMALRRRLLHRIGCPVLEWENEDLRTQLEVVNVVRVVEQEFLVEKQARIG